MPFDLRDLRWIVIVSELRSLRRTGAHLNVQQSAVSRRIKKLEERLGVQLFERGNNGTHPTVAGLELLAVARRIVGDVDTIHRQLKARSNRRRSALAIGMQASSSIGNMPALLADLLRRSPETHLHIEDGSAGYLLETVRDRRLDVAIVMADPGRWQDAALPLWSERMVVAVPADHPLAARGAVLLSELVGEALFLPEHGPGPDLAQLLEGRGYGAARMRLTFHRAGLDHILTLVKAGYGALLMLEGGSGMRCDGVVHREVRDDGALMRVEFMACWSTVNKNPSLRAFLNILRERHPDLNARSE